MKWLSLATLVVVAHSAAAPAAAKATDLDEHPKTAATIVSVEIDSLLATLDELAGLGRANRMVLGFARAAIDRAIGFKAADPASWKANGVDPAAPISVSLTFDSAALERRYIRLLGGDARTEAALAAPAYWHVRVVVPALDAVRARAFIHRLPTGLTWSKDGVRGATQDGRSNASLRASRGFVILDLVRPAFAAALEPPTETGVAT